MSLLLHVIPTAFDLLAIMLCIGLLATVAWVVPRNAQNVKGLRDVLWQALAWVIAGLTVMSIVMVLLRTMEMSGRAWNASFSSLPLVLLETHYGMTWFVRIAAITVLWSGWWWGVKKGIGLLFPEGKNRLSPFLYAMLLAAACVVWSVSASSHAADWGDFTLTEWVSWLHIMGASLWVGGLLVFVLVIRRRLRGPSDRTQALFAICAGRLSSLAGMALAMVLTTGAYNVWRQLDHVSELWSSNYGRIILFKLMLVGVMTAIGAFSRYFTLPLLRRGEGGPLHAQRSSRLSPLRLLRRLHLSCKPGEAGAPPARQFARGVTVEAWLALGVLVCAALLGHAMPPKKQGHTIQHTMILKSGVQEIYCPHNERWPA
ncbi:MAG: CopD family protein [Mariprofundaceae bacterium]|nr:CopD family protein [Mariprofundaceae bacterium]